ncbi:MULTISPECIES: SIS domain-containing protein [Pseudoalteromonas]|uniref:SIS domain-containing protein n=1 Tax=Pseudoalteromonas haloplanktis TaxID=228 RepID=A0ABU1BFK9_PSEHA|nr:MULTISPECIES: SIS domain-containing protein [Pseudoalteromonas]MCF6144246.1 DnaA initiator-associating protein [Pseudoalteromonas mariniglutinosa NCIMB 1770]MDQ9092709.1 SIS domain-containing protein [Pseudoalteromonas haloplanktis]TMN70583.1 SIS domain-containing protein [Pseudoalteromonas sp. S1727]BDF96415.1 phosphoheptose isomerase [Pseudoalteromonas sp. KAN5]
MQDTIKEIFTESIQVQIAAGEVLPSALEAAAFTIAQSLINGNKLICCGTASCHMLAQHMAGVLINYYETERPCLPAIALSQEHINLGQNNQSDDQDTFARQVRAFAQQGDLLLVLAINGNEKNIISAVEAALTKDMKVIVLVGDDGGELVGLLGANDVEIRVPSKRPSRIIESHLVNLHCLSELVDLTLFPQEEN